MPSCTLDFVRHRVILCFYISHQYHAQPKSTKKHLQARNAACLHLWPWDTLARADAVRIPACSPYSCLQPCDVIRRKVPRRLHGVLEAASPLIEELDVFDRGHRPRSLDREVEGLIRVLVSFAAVHLRRGIRVLCIGSSVIVLSVTHLKSYVGIEMAWHGIMFRSNFAERKCFVLVCGCEAAVCPVHFVLVWRTAKIKTPVYTAD